VKTVVGCIQGAEQRPTILRERIRAEEHQVILECLSWLLETCFSIRAPELSSCSRTTVAAATALLDHYSLLLRKFQSPWSSGYR